MEMAICTNCRDKISEELSQESLMRINAYVDERCDWEQRFDDAKEWEATDLQQWLDKCVLLKTPASECQEYQIAAVCRGDLMSIDLLPILISGAASEEMQKLMSKKTRDRLGEMVDDFFGMPSEFVDSPQSYSPTIW